ncbi:MAG TPA: flagellar basal-body MS-ring/collar protein FliF [Oscillospiraceae bacterium]|nr:flagellar basal-body MS-ring/collar protein FliF [Oscillospiraceae bacterium]
MNEQIKKYIDPIKNFWGKLTKKVKIIIFSVLGGLIVLSLILGIIMNQPKYTVLYPKLSNTEATEVMNVLKDLNVDYKENGGTISVPSDKENSLRMQLANQGYPKSTTNYDFFTKNVSIMTTDAERKTIAEYQLNQRLEAVIKTLDPISDANVTITIPETSNFVWDDNKTVATASVAVSLNTGKTLTTTNVAGIKQLVAKSVPNMTTDNVAVIDKATGDELSSTVSAASTQVDISQFKLEIQKQYENDMKKKILSLLQPVYGAAHVNATVTCNMDLDKKIADSIIYTPSKDNRGVINKETTEKGQTTSSPSSVGGVAGATTNTGGTSTASTSTTSTASGSTGSTTTTYPGITVNGNTIYSTDNASYEYLVSQMKQQVQGDAASVKDLSVAVVIDNAAMTDQQKAQISSMVANAASIQANKVSVFNSKFFTESSMAQPTVGPLAGIDTKVLIIGGAILGIILLAVIAFIIISNQKKQKMRQMIAGLNAQEPNEDEEESDEMEEPFEEISTEDIGEDFGTGDKKAPIVIDDIQSHRESLDSKDEALKKELHDFSSQNPEIAAQLIRTWLRGDDEKHG